MIIGTDYCCSCCSSVLSNKLDYPLLLTLLMTSSSMLGQASKFPGLILLFDAFETGKRFEQQKKTIDPRGLCMFACKVIIKLR